jgi:sphinganine-1-phosphate aldolase
MSFPTSGQSWPALKAQMAELRRGDVDWRNGRAPLHIYFAGADVLEIVSEAYTMFMSENALAPAAFPSLAKMEQDVVGAAIGLFNGPPTAAGSMTSGGTESIILAAQSARDWAVSASRLGAGRPEMLMAETAHPAFDKAARLLGLDVRRVPAGPDYRADPRSLEDAISDRTIFMVASVPSLPFGLIDRVEDIAKIARRHDIWLHVDACLGGYIAPFAAKLGYPVPRFDFSIPGVRSISADLHKFGYAAKGASTLLFRARPSGGRRNGFAFADWPKGSYDTPTLLGTRSGGAIAAAWAVIHYLGEQGYLGLTERVMKLRERYLNGITGMQDLRLIAPPDLSIIAYASDTLDISAVGDCLEKRHWYVSRIARPPGLHQTINLIHELIVDDYLADLASCVEEVRANALVGSRLEVSCY